MSKIKSSNFFIVNGINIVAFALLIIGLSIAITGHIYEHGAFNLQFFISDFYSNFGTEFISIAITVLILDKLSQQRQIKIEEERLKKELLNRVRSQVNDQAIFALEQLALMGLLFNGELEDADFSHANLHQAHFISNYNPEGAELKGANFRSARLTEAWFYNADLENASMRHAKLQKSHLFNTNLRKAGLQGAHFEGAYFFGADLSDATADNIHFEDANIWETNLFNTNITDEMLMKAKRLRGSIMPDGNRYNGKFNLVGDLEDAQIDGIDVGNPIAMAAWYVVSDQSYQDGQNNI